MSIATEFQVCMIIAGYLLIVYAICLVMAAAAHDLPVPEEEPGLFVDWDADATWDEAA